MDRSMLALSMSGDNVYVKNPNKSRTRGLHDFQKL